MRFEFREPLWRWQGGEAAWYFITLPLDLTDEIRAITEGRRGGFGSVKVRARSGGSTWSTSLFPSKQLDSFLLPVKKQVREAEGMAEQQPVSVTIEIVNL